ncbi:hypothetical protein D7V97_04885 [Corallococcus sp. CA053C]|nr:hypothetical protein D7V97_04885 [Corallococcus sp. CA053C]
MCGQPPPQPFPPRAETWRAASPPTSQKVRRKVLTDAPKGCELFKKKEDGGFYGWPFACFGANEDPRLAGQRPARGHHAAARQVPCWSRTTRAIPWWKMSAKPRP